MTRNHDHKRASARSFGAHADAYVDSRVHREGSDLDQLAAWCTGASRALDVATGPGNTAHAVADAGVGTVVATDAAPEMVETATATHHDIAGVVADAERLPFRSDRFDAVTCRIAAHHFPNPVAFVEEVYRVLEPGGVFAFEDNIAPSDRTLDELLNRIERLRDPTHVRSHTASEWLDWLESAGFTVHESFEIEKTIDYHSWVTQLETPEENRTVIESKLTEEPANTQFSVRIERGGVESFSNVKLLLLATT